MPDPDIGYPGARAPDRTYRLDADGIGLATNEWGDAAAPPLLAVHGGSTFPASQSYFPLPPAERPPDPSALVELSRDLRPPDYAAAFVR